MAYLYELFPPLDVLAKSMNDWADEHNEQQEKGLLWDEIWQYEVVVSLEGNPPKRVLRFEKDHFTPWQPPIFSLPGSPLEPGARFRVPTPQTQFPHTITVTDGEAEAHSFASSSGWELSS